MYQGTLRNILGLVYVVAALRSNSFSEGAEMLGPELRLVAGNGLHEGNVEVSVGGEWGFICDDDFGFSEADMICRHLGYRSASRFTRNNHFGRNSPEWGRKEVKIWVQHLNCSDSATDLENCHSDEVGFHDCGPTEIAGVVCYQDGQSLCALNEFSCDNSETCITRDSVCDGNYDCPDKSDETDALCNDVGVTRVESLVSHNIPGATAGAVQIKRDGEWGKVCDRNLQSGNEAKVICRNLGYNGGWILGFPSSYLGEAEGRTVVTVPECTGEEQWIGECPEVSWWKTRCRVDNEDYGVFCYDGGMDVRLTGDKSKKRGRVEMKLEDTWGGICDTGFDVLDAQVVCRMLGYKGDAEAYKMAGVSHGPMWEISLNCYGHENNLQECSVRFLNSSCPKGSCAGVVCSHSRGQLDQALSSALGDPECGLLEDASSHFITSLGKVRGGHRRSPYDTPWLAVLRERESKFSFCGGIIISEDYVLTAAHCVDDILPSEIVVRVGDYNEDIEEQFEQEFFIDKFWIHDERHEQAFGDNDIALIKIEREYNRGIRFSAVVQPVCLPKSDMPYDNLKGCSVSGVGPRNYKEDPSKYPLVGKQDIVRDYLCEESVFGGPHNYTASFVCAGFIHPTFINPCNGDSGGPLVCPIGGRYIVVGIVSTGPPCATLPSYDLYVRLTMYLGWILEKIRSVEGHQQ